jgi:hypothetical protein
LIRDREYLFAHADWAGAYLYMKWLHKWLTINKKLKNWQ